MQCITKLYLYANVRCSSCSPLRESIVKQGFKITSGIIKSIEFGVNLHKNGKCLLTIAQIIQYSGIIWHFTINISIIVFEPVKGFICAILLNINAIFENMGSIKQFLNKCSWNWHWEQTSIWFLSAKSDPFFMSVLLKQPNQSWIKPSLVWDLKQAPARIKVLPNYSNMLDILCLCRCLSS